MTPTKDDYQREWALECAVEYPSVDAFERRMGYAIDRIQLDSAARVLACPVKRNPACWQHGRVVYSALGRRISQMDHGSEMLALDIGTAKGFSAVCIEAALNDIGDGEDGILNGWQTISLDVIDPLARVRRNTVAEIDGLLTLRETLDASEVDMRLADSTAAILFLQSTGVTWLKANSARVHFAFIDGKHTHDAVSTELINLARVQQKGDMVVLDDLQVPGVHDAAAQMTSYYHIEQIDAVPANETADRRHAPRRYGVGIRR